MTEQKQQATEQEEQADVLLVDVLSAIDDAIALAKALNALDKEIMGNVHGLVLDALGRAKLSASYTLAEREVTNANVALANGDYKAAFEYAKSASALGFTARLEDGQFAIPELVQARGKKSSTAKTVEHHEDDSKSALWNRANRIAVDVYNKQPRGKWLGLSTMLDRAWLRKEVEEQLGKEDFAQLLKELGKEYK